MRIAFITNSYPPRLGGLEQHIENLAQGLAALNHSVWVLTISQNPGYRCDAHVRVLTGKAHLPIANVITLPAVGTTRALAKFLRAQHIDVVSTHTRFFPMSFVGVRAAHKAGIPVIHTEHGSDFVANPNPVIALGSRTVDLSLGRYVLRHADQVLGVSQPAADFAQRLGARHPKVFYNAITPPAVKPPITARPTHLVFVGRMVAGKGWDLFLQAISALTGRGFSLSAEMLGDGAELEAARRCCTKLGLDAIVNIRGRVTPAQVRQALAGATLVNPSTLSEGFQTTLLEAIAERGRVVTFAVPSAQLLKESGAPLMICPHKNLASLTENLAAMLTDPLPLGAPELIEAWTWPVRCQQYAQIAARVIAAQPQNR